MHESSNVPFWRYNDKFIDTEPIGTAIGSYIDVMLLLGLEKIESFEVLSRQATKEDRTTFLGNFGSFYYKRYYKQYETPPIVVLGLGGDNVGWEMEEMARNAGII
jgi:hypothetical protein